MGDWLAGWFERIAGRLFGPVFALEATRVGRRLSTFLIRWTYLLILVGVLGVFFHSGQQDLVDAYKSVDLRARASFAESFFWMYAFAQFLIVCAFTPVFTATITDEKERKTLDFLLVTNLSGLEIVFGKLAVRIGVLLMLVLAGLPVIALLQFFGGIEPQLLFLTTGMTLVTVLSLSAVSALASMLMNRNRDAVILAYAIPAAYLYVSLQFPSRVLDDMLEAVTAGDPFRVARDIDRGSSWSGVPNEALRYIAFHGVVAVLGFALATAFFRRSARSGGTPKTKSHGALKRFLAWALGQRIEALEHQHPPVSDRPVWWREVDLGTGGGVLRRLLMLGLLIAVFWPFVKIVRSAFGITRGGYS